VETLYREALGELAICYDGIYKSLGGEGETYILYRNTNGRVYDCISFCPMRPVFIGKLRLPIAYLYYLIVPPVKETTFNSICVRQSLLITNTMTAIFLIMTSNFVIADIIHKR